MAVEAVVPDFVPIAAGVLLAMAAEVAVVAHVALE